jgi:hypothetical protein
MYTGNRCGGGLNFYPNVYTLVREEVSASAGTATHVYTATCTYTDKRTNVDEHIDEREFEGGFSHPSSLFLSPSPPFCVTREKESGKARIRSAVNLKINIDRGAANPLFIDADCWLHGRDAPRRLLLSPSYFSHSIPLVSVAMLFQTRPE